LAATATATVGCMATATATNATSRPSKNTSLCSRTHPVECVVR
jgi:hypothetical protein